MPEKSQVIDVIDDVRNSMSGMFTSAVQASHVEMTTKVRKFEEILRKNAATDAEAPKAAPEPAQKKARKKALPAVPRGKPKSGRVWKSQKTRFSGIIKSKSVKSSFEQKERLRKELKIAKEASRAVHSARAEARELKKQRRRENLERQKKNELKSEVVQVITNTSKLKRMKKKQLRNVQKRDTN